MPVTADVPTISFTLTAPGPIPELGLAEGQEHTFTVTPTTTLAEVDEMARLVDEYDWRPGRRISPSEPERFLQTVKDLFVQFHQVQIERQAVAQ